MSLKDDPVIVTQIDIWICRGGTGIVSDHIPHSEHAYHQVSGRESRYRIRYCDGSPCYLPHRIYEGPLSEECYFASGLVKPLPKFIREIDSTYFKYFDWADDVRRNIIIFLSWLNNLPENLPKKKRKHILKENEHLIRQRPVDPEWMKQNITNGSGENNFKDLNSFEQYLISQKYFIDP